MHTIKTRLTISVVYRRTGCVLPEFFFTENAFSVSKNYPNRSRPTVTDADFSTGGNSIERFIKFPNGLSLKILQK